MWWNIQFAKRGAFRSTLLVDRAGREVLEKLTEVFPQGDELVLLLTILLTWSSWSLSPKWPLSSSDVSTFLASPISQNLRNIYIFVIQSVAFTAVIIPSNLSYSHKYGAYSYLLLFITQNIWYKFLSSFIFSPNVVKKREGVLLDKNWLLLLNGEEMV